MDIVRRPIFLSFLIQFQTNFLKGFDPLWRSEPRDQLTRELPAERLVVSLALHKRKADKWEVRLFFITTCSPLSDIISNYATHTNPRKWKNVN